MKDNNGKKGITAILLVLMVLILGTAGFLVYRVVEGRVTPMDVFSATNSKDASMTESGLADMESSGAALSDTSADEAASGVTGSGAALSGTASGAASSSNAAADTTKSASTTASAPAPTTAATPTPTPDPVSQQSVNDISIQDLSQYRSEMPADGQEIVGTSTSAYTYEQMVKDLYFLSVRYPGLMTYDSLGVTADQRSIMEAVIGNPQASRHIVVQYSIHAREYINSLLAMRQLETYLENVSGGGTFNGRTYTDLFSNVCIHLLPMANPDGVTVSESGLAGLRRERMQQIVHWCWESDTGLGRTSQPIEQYLKTFKANANGVDLNKNFDIGWSGYTDGVPVPSTDCYKGGAAASEPETQAILKAVESNPTVCVIAYHSSGDTIYWNYGTSGDILESDRYLAESVRNLTGYALSNSKKYDHTLAGGCADYFVWAKGIPSITIETGTGNCPLDISKFAHIWDKNKEVLPLLASMYGS